MHNFKPQPVRKGFFNPFAVDGTNTALIIFHTLWTVQNGILTFKKYQVRCCNADSSVHVG